MKDRSFSLREFYKDKRVLVTGHTGFKGSWMMRTLILLGAQVTGYSLDAPTDPSLFEMADIKDHICHLKGDIRDLESLKKAFDKAKPEIVIHMAAQPIVRTSYEEPVYTYETNVMGTVNVLECVRQCSCVRSVVNVTTDKVYKNNEWEWGYRESDVLGGYDPYSSSKSCSELVTDSYRNSFFGQDKRSCAISTVRAGNVIGGGDFARDRIIPDCIRAVLDNRQIIVRNPHSIRPYQFVMEPVYAYLYLAARQYEDMTLEGSYNVGPDDNDILTTGDITDMFCHKWNMIYSGASWQNVSDKGPHEAGFLKLDTSKIRQKLGYKRRTNVSDALDRIIEFTKVLIDKGDIPSCMDEQIKEFID
ncbi:CDP-glucose 4,6-dehydratase [Butyrivibrio fibrisolvens]|uniref:CDP-glucose 4,6-dehydratase n=1 Tax=Butyrivibrio fibrisolvens TaxID=831 RepID=A0A1H9TAS0_BUTFI|nr:CDP-glucose 4,6-dehydratase [Butyrivibrio fibrisolvens]SER94322.1 CDP-glucose 4,6-dehydratase [Butyrivibrio fibrisolvens]